MSYLYYKSGNIGINILIVKQVNYNKDGAFCNILHLSIIRFVNNLHQHGE
jgi:hypothetical protein